MSHESKKWSKFTLRRLFLVVGLAAIGSGVLRFMVPPDPRFAPHWIDVDGKVRFDVDRPGIPYSQMRTAYWTDEYGRRRYDDSPQLIEIQRAVDAGKKQLKAAGWPASEFRRKVADK